MDLILGPRDEPKKLYLEDSEDLLNRWSVKIKLDKEFWGW